jgi:hypothetical protein
MAAACGRAPATPRPTSTESATTTETTTETPTGTSSSNTCAPLAAPSPIVQVDGAVPSIESFSDGAMAHVYERLAQLVRGRARDHVRIALYGDSNMTMDYLSGEMRRVFQRRFGDGGHGYITFAKHLFYHHMDVEQGGGSAGWVDFTISNNPTPDGAYGFGMVAAQSYGAGATAWVSTAKDGAPIGRTASRFDVYYLKRPGAGTFEVAIDGEKRVSVDANGDAVAAGFERIDVADGPHKLEVKTTSKKPVRLFGVALERSTPSVVVDSLGVTSLDVKMMTARSDRAVLGETLAHRGYDLVVVMTGTNEWFEPEVATKVVGAAVERHRAALPNVSFLVLSPADRAERPGAPSSAAIATTGREKRDAARAAGVAFWDLRGAMGGDGSIQRFYEKKLAMVDMRHLTERGGAWVGDRLAAALWSGFTAWLVSHPMAGCVE